MFIPNVYWIESWSFIEESINLDSSNYYRYLAKKTFSFENLPNISNKG